MSLSTRFDTEHPEGLLLPESVRQVESGGKSWWTDTLSHVYCEMDPQWVSDKSQFEANLSARSFGDLFVSTVAADAHSVIRTPAMITGSQADDFFLCAVTRGPGSVHQGGRSVVLDRGDFTVIDSGQPYRFDFPGLFEQVVVRIPREALLHQVSESAVQHVIATPVSASAGAGIVVSNLIQQIAQMDAALGETDARALSTSAIDMIVTSLQAGGLGESATKAAHEEDLRRARQHFVRRMHDETVTMAELASDLGMSVRYLQKIFANDGATPSEWLLRARLERARLIMKSSDVTLGEVSTRVGFKDQSHFSRCFRRQYGVSPGRYRQA